ncbi:ribonuclease H-like domain-containing protein [Mycena alexandri]|uniref:RNA exonuclease 4 n=1 Tax=Mycena alexandri TaxID=1745969 RepID=A0AAD6SJN9_9AGAR|nr:ribonuclease H-like domain-containing protein [Mycena alexandri]
MPNPKKATPRPAPSSNWLALQKVLPRKRDSSGLESAQEVPRKRRKVAHSDPGSASVDVVPVKLQARPTSDAVVEEKETMKNGESLPALRKMIFGAVEYTEAQRQPGKYLALDCEMVGVGPEGVESSLARVSLVNYHGAVQLDAFVRQRERVVDYRTEFSGVRESDMINAKPFPEIQAQVAALLQDRILVGHAVFNDLKVLLLSHPRAATRDTQYYAGKFKLAKSTRVALRNLVKQEVGATIQGGEHSSVTDARATMAVYRLHRKEWEKGTTSRPLPQAKTKGKGKAEASPSDDDDDEEAEGDADVPQAKKKKSESEKPKTFPGGGRKGVSSGLGTVVRRQGTARGGRGGEDKRSVGAGGGGGAEWWKELGGGAKGSMRL